MELSNEFEVRAPVDQAWAVLTDLERIAPCLPGAQLQEVEGQEYRGIVKVKVGPITAQYKGAAHFVEKDDDSHRAVLSASGRDTRGQGNASASITAELTPKGDITHVSVLTDLTITGKVAQFGRGVIGDVSAKLLDQFVENLEATVLGADATSSDDGGSTEAAGEETSMASITDKPAPNETTQMLASELKKVWSDDDGKADDAVRVEREALPPRPDLLVPNETTPASEAASSAPAAEASASEASEGARRIESAEAEPIDLLDAAGGSVAKRLVPAVIAAVVLIAVVGLLRRRRRSR